ncbi:MAG TPA: HDOD domain-containing protein [Candidatus Acidoferrum sp.]
MFEKFIARQPIFDEKLKVFAYELLFRASSHNVFEFRKEASSTAIVDSVTLFDLQALTGHAKAFVNVDEAALRREAPRLLPPDRVILEILETVVPSPEVVEICRGLRASGYVIALDDFVDHEKWAPLTELAKFIKVDFRITGGEMRRALVQRFRGRGVQLLAEKVETQEEVQEARALGYTLFQGFFFCKPAMVAVRDIPGNKLNYVRLLEAVSAREFSRERIEELLKQDPSLVFKLLRYLNSPILGLRSEVRGISHAISLLGDVEFRRWISILAIVGMASDKPPELIRTALTRGFFCEEFSRLTEMTVQSADLFLLGLLSVTDAILDRPIENILSSLPVSSEVRTALCGGANGFRDVYDTLLAYEQADWNALSNAAGRIGPIEAAVPDCYQAAAARAGALIG